MQTVTLGKTGITVDKNGFGALPIQRVAMEEAKTILRRAFDGSYSVSGTPFLEEDGFPGCGNAIIYGHHMNNGTMFGAVSSYAKEDFWREHPEIRFDTRFEEGVYHLYDYQFFYRNLEENVQARLAAYLAQTQQAAA